MPQIVNIAIDRLFPHSDNPRKDLGDLSELAASIKASGVLQNLTVVPDEPDNPDTDYTIIIGHRRYAAAKIAGLTELPCIVVEMSEREQLQTMLVENIVETIEDGAAKAATKLYISYDKIKTADIGDDDIVKGIEAIDLCMATVSTTPDLIIAPGWSHTSTVQAVMAAKAEVINGILGAKSICDIDCSASGARSYDAVAAKKSATNLIDPAQIAVWPQVKLGSKQFHLSTQLAGLMAKVDSGNDGVPYESPSNKALQCDGACLEDGTDVTLTLEQANILNANGICTALKFMNGFVAWGNYTACYPSNTDIKDYFIPISRMFKWVGNSLIKTFWSKTDSPMNRRLLDNIKDSANNWLAGLVGSEYLLGARVEILDSENPMTDLMAGIVRIHIYMTPPSPAQEIDFVLEYDTDYVQSALA